MFRVHFGKLRKNGFKSTKGTISPYQSSPKELVKFYMQYTTAMKCITTNKKIREIGEL